MTTYYLIKTILYGTPVYDDYDRLLGFDNPQTNFELMSKEEYEYYSLIKSIERVAELSERDLLGLHNQSETILNQIHSYPVS